MRKLGEEGGEEGGEEEEREGEGPPLARRSPKWGKLVREEDLVLWYLVLFFSSSSRFFRRVWKTISSRIVPDRSSFLKGEEEEGEEEGERGGEIDVEEVVVDGRGAGAKN